MNTLPLARTLPALIEEVASLRPNGDAMIHDGTTWSWGDLRLAARTVASSLISRGVPPRSRVAVLFGNRPEWIISALGVLYAGGTVVPLNTWYKRRELEWTLRHAECSVLLSAAKVLKMDYGSMLGVLSESMPDSRTIVFWPTPVNGTSALGWDEFLAAGRFVDRAEVEGRWRAVSSEDAAFILYTSGSTALPKGVLLQHGPLIANGFEIGARRLFTISDRVWLGSPLFYGLGAANALPATLAHGACLVLQDHFEAGPAIDLIEASRATVYYGTGNMTAAILAHPSYDRARIASLERGNAGTSAHYKRLALIEMGIAGATPAYGLTETYGHATGGMPDDPVEVKLGTDGLPLPGMKIEIVDPDTGAARVQGEVGLILIRGRVSPGYLGNEDESRKAFRFEGCLDSGDLGSLDPAGRLIFHSRLKEIIKSGGISVAPTEVEYLLAQHPAVRDAHVVGVAHPTRGELIVAFVECADEVSEADLRDFVRERAASFKVPHRIFFRAYDQIPRLASGKVAKIQLREQAAEELLT